MGGHGGTLERYCCCFTQTHRSGDFDPVARPAIAPKIQRFNVRETKLTGWNLRDNKMAGRIGFDKKI